MSSLGRLQARNLVTVHAKSNEVVEERRQLLENKCEF
jgi:hypothetical protein